MDQPPGGLGAPIDFLAGDRFPKESSAQAGALDGAPGVDHPRGRLRVLLGTLPQNFAQGGDLPHRDPSMANVSL